MSEYWWLLIYAPLVVNGLAVLVYTIWKKIFRDPFNPNIPHCGWLQKKGERRRDKHLNCVNSQCECKCHVPGSGWLPPPG